MKLIRGTLKHGIPELLQATDFVHIRALSLLLGCAVLLISFFFMLQLAHPVTTQLEMAAPGIRIC